MDVIEVVALLYEISIAYVIGKILKQTVDENYRNRSRDNPQYNRHILSAISHSLQTPLAVIQGEIELLPEYTRAPGKFKTITECLARLSQFVRQFLYYVRIDAHADYGTFTRVPLSHLVQEQVEYIEVMGHAEQVTVSATIEPDIVIRGDAELLEQLILNLAHNAIKYRCPERDCTLHIVLRRIVDTVELVCMDNGIGIDAKEHHHVFDQFYRVPEHTSQSAGFGLGLAIVKRIVDMHGATITLTSALDEGATFTILFPVPRDV